MASKQDPDGEQTRQDSELYGAYANTISYLFTHVHMHVMLSRIKVMRLNGWLRSWLNPLCG